ncbi:MULTISPECIES: molecular chaperone [Serratia]|nr:MULTISPECIES: molecular chaperone [Serratia]CAI1004836.1 Chaperone protein focC precursor [Serratia quinivorans]CAI1090704.1 Chaperone protein focC precursor [Serratia quinivorans]CAI2121436.1 Chaperone protein focC precursor [Serratia quinivorans]CAI2488303.1 Chaperone protein focC precursor [Serratia liquefaciens]
MTVKMKAGNRFIVGCVLMTLAGSALAGVGFSRNRMVYPQGSQSISLTVNNSGDNPYLIQGKVSTDTLGKASAPFIVTPPLFRLEGQQSAMLRLIMTGANLPDDRETVFYFSGRAIPASVPGEAKGDGIGASVSMSLRSVMKVFYRPKGLAMSQEQSVGKVAFTQTAKGVLIKNPTPYYQSFAELLFDGKPQNLDSEPSMVLPFGELLKPSAVLVSQVTWRVMNDYGGTTELKTQGVASGTASVK